jgi:Pyruvate/2-oxoacid:ferredoxin oxidoreductase delta subunit
MDFEAFVEGSLLKITFIIFFIAILIRFLFFIFSIIKNSGNSENKVIYIPIILARFLVPFHKAVLKKPVYSSLRYIFHICLFVVPIWLAGHISMWEESRFEWTWSPIPDEWADGMTLIVLALAVIFIIRHFAIKDVRMNTSFSDYLIILIAALPFATGYSLTHGTLDSVPFLGDNMWTIHILTGEIMIVTAAFLFCRTRLNELKCTGCASCVLSCPTGTLETRESGNVRLFDYSHYQCICCGSCVNTCPENAAELRHEINLKRLYHVFAKQEIRSVELEACDRCGALFVPEPLMDKIHKAYTHEYLNFCPDCRKRSRGEFIRKISPWHHKTGQYA